MKFDINELKWTRTPKDFSISDDKIEIVTNPHTDLWQRTFYHFRNDNAPVLQMETDKKFFSFTVKTQFQSKCRFDQCGIVMYLDGENWLKGSIEYENDTFGHLGSVVTNNGYSDWATSGESRETVRRYIRLTNLVKPLLDMVDEGRIAFTPAVELSYLNEIEQQDLVEAIFECDATPNLSQACRFKKMSAEQGLTPESITEILYEQKANQKPMFKIHYEKLHAVAPKIKESDFEAFVLEACQRHYKYLERQKDRER